MTPEQERAEQEIDDRLLEAQLALQDCMDELEQVKSEREDWKFGSNANAREMQRLDGELRKTREMVRELVGALEFSSACSDHMFGNAPTPGLDPSFYHSLSHSGDMELHGKAVSARAVLAKYKAEIDQLERDQNGAISKKLMREME